jgi:hypothetical protein
MFFPIELLQVPVSVGSLFLSYFFAIYFFNHRLYLRHVAMLSLFFKMPIEKNLWSILRFLVKLELFLTIFLPSKILLNNNIYEKSTILWAFYTVILSLFFWVFLISGNVYFFSLSMLYLILHIEILVFALLIKNDFLKMNLLFSLGLSHQEFDEIVFFFLGNTHFKTILSSAAAVGTAGVITIAEMSREYSVASAESLMMFNQNVKKAEVAIQVYEQMPIEKSLPQDFFLTFDLFREKGLSLEQALSEAKSLTDTAYAKVKQPPHIVDSLIDLDKRRLADFDKALSKQPLYSLIPEIKDLLKK